MPQANLADLPHYTYAEYAEWEGNWELIHGIPHAMSPAPSIQHQQISSRIDRQLNELLENCPHCHPLLPVDWRIDDDTVVQPDNLVVCYEPSGPYLTKSPTLIFEILSAATRKKDATAKFHLYQQEGVKYYALVDPEIKQAKIYVLHEGRYIKLADATDETIRFELGPCTMDFTFSSLW